MPQQHNLQGLEPDNLLAFLASVGLHRAVAHARPDWSPRLFWSGVPLRPQLILSRDVDQSGLLDVAAEGCELLAQVHSFEDRDLIDFNQQESKQLLREASLRAKPGDRLHVDLLSALMSDAAHKDDKVRPTAFCCQFGQSHQYFLKRLQTVAKGEPPRELKGVVTAADLNSPRMLRAALFERWKREDVTESFRWDPLEDRRHALRFQAPTKEKAKTVHGANRLASLALPLFPVFPRTERGEIRLSTTAVQQGRTGTYVHWPVWSRPATLNAVSAMLSCTSPDHSPPGIGIIRVYRAERISVGKLMNFTRAIPANHGV